MHKDVENKRTDKSHKILEAGKQVATTLAGKYQDP